MIKAPDRNVSITHGLYGHAPKIQYNIPHEEGKDAMKKQGRIPKPKYNNKIYGRQGNNLVMGVEIMSIAKHLFTDVQTERYLIKCLEDGDDGEFALHKAIKYEHLRMMKADKAMHDKNMVFSEDDLEYLKLLNINPEGGLKMHESGKIRELIDENGNIRTDVLERVIRHIM